MFAWSHLWLRRLQHLSLRLILICVGRLHGSASALYHARAVELDHVHGRVEVISRELIPFPEVISRELITLLLITRETHRLSSPERFWSLQSSPWFGKRGKVAQARRVIITVFGAQRSPDQLLCVHSSNRQNADMLNKMIVVSGSIVNMCETCAEGRVWRASCQPARTTTTLTTSSWRNVQFLEC